MCTDCLKRIRCQVGPETNIVISDTQNICMFAQHNGGK